VCRVLSSSVGAVEYGGKAVDREEGAGGPGCHMEFGYGFPHPIRSTWWALGQNSRRSILDSGIVNALYSIRLARAVALASLIIQHRLHLSDPSTRCPRPAGNEVPTSGFPFLNCKDEPDIYAIGVQGTTPSFFLPLFFVTNQHTNTYTSHSFTHCVIDDGDEMTCVLGRLISLLINIHLSCTVLGVGAWVERARSSSILLVSMFSLPCPALDMPS
jgi:hypothetical protein